MFRQRSIFPGSHPPSVVDAKELNFRVRYGYGWVLLAIATESAVPSLLNNVNRFQSLTPENLGQALDLLVSFSSMRYRTSTYDLSTISSIWGLTRLLCGKSYLEGGFTLRCLQRLSRPHVATQLCRWHDNWCTSGASIPVLSY